MLNDKIIDPFNGQQDLKKRILRTVGNPYERFSEDYLRIIRAARFQARFGLKLAEGLLEAAIDLSPKIIHHVSIERITDEFKKAQKHGAEFIQTSKDLGFLKYILPEFLNLDDGQYNLWLNEIRCSKSYLSCSILHHSSYLLTLIKLKRLPENLN